MNWRTYQKYLSDGGWETVTTQGQELRELRIQCDDIEDRLEKLEKRPADSWATQALAIVCMVALCIIFLLILTGVP